MPLFEIQQPGGVLKPFRQLHGGAELYESEIESLLWDSLEDLTGESLFPVARQPNIRGGGRPDIVAVTRQGRLVVIEVKRDVDRGQLAQCLEYAGWARTAGLDELAGLYHRTPERFFEDWQEFTETPVPQLIQGSPRLMLVARDFHGRTGSAFDFLVENDLPVKLVRISLYEDQDGRRFVDVEGEHEPTFPEPAGPRDAGSRDHTKIEGRRVRLDDLVDAGLLRVGERLTWERPRVGAVYRALVTENGALEIENGGVWSSPSRAAKEAAGVPAMDGWLKWRTDQGVILDELRRRLVVARAREDDETLDADS